MPLKQFNSHSYDRFTATPKHAATRSSVFNSQKLIDVTSPQLLQATDKLHVGFVSDYVIETAVEARGGCFPTPGDQFIRHQVLASSNCGGR